MSSTAATVDDLIGYLPALSTRQVSKVVIPTSPPDGAYAVELDDVLAESTGAGSTATQIRDELATELDPTELATILSMGAGTVKLTGAKLGVAFAVELSAPVADPTATLTTTPAAGVPQSVLETYLALASKFVANECMWGDCLSEGQALRALHELSASGTMASYDVMDPGEVGVLTGSSLGPSSSSYAGPVVGAGSESQFSTTKWGRMYWRVWIPIRPCGGAGLLDASEDGACL